MNPIAHSPHAHAPVSIGKVMGTVLLALTPATLFGFWLYGWPAINLWAVSLIAAIVGEAFAVRLQNRRSASGIDGRFRNIDCMAAGNFPAAVRALVDRRAGQPVRGRHRQAGVRRTGAEPVQSRRWPRA